MECYTQEHFLFVAIATCVVIIFPTIVLILYPMRLFRRCVSCCGFCRWHALHVFMESFQGQYKDGTNDTRDFRMVSATFLILRLVMLVLFLNRHNYTWISSGLLLAGVSCFHATTRSYKLNFMNNIDIAILFLLEVLAAAASNPSPKHYTYAILTSVLLLGVPHMVLIFHICCKLTKKAGITQCLKRIYESLKICARCTGQTEADVEREFDTGSLPDRLLNPEEYESVLSTREEHTAAEPTENKQHVNEDIRRMIPVHTYGSMN